MQRSWQALVVETMLELRRDGQDFDGAWNAAMTLHPPRGRDLGPERPTLLDRDESLVMFFRRCCEDAWHGRRPGLAHFDASLLMEPDGTTAVVRAARHRRVHFRQPSGPRRSPSADDGRPHAVERRSKATR
jgi:hypothetical protein